MNIDKFIEKLYAERKLNPPHVSNDGLCRITELEPEARRAARIKQEVANFVRIHYCEPEESWWRPLVSYFSQVFAGFGLVLLLGWAWPFLSPVVGVMLMVSGIALFLLVSAASALFKVIAGLGILGLFIVGLILWGLRQAYREDPEDFKEKVREYLRPATILFFIVLTVVVVGLDAFFTALLK